MYHLMLCALTVLSIRSAKAALCTPGTTWIEGKFKVECYTNGLIVGSQPVACVPGGQNAGKEFIPGQTWIEGNFKFECGMSANGVLKTAIVGCLIPETKQEIPLDGFLLVDGVGKYKCNKRVDGTIIRDVESGCIQNGQLYAYQAQWVFNNAKYYCSFRQGKYQAFVDSSPIVPQPATPQPTTPRPATPAPATRPPVQPGRLCNPGSVWIQNNFKMECYTNGVIVGYQPVACVPSGKLGDKEYIPGQTWIERGFKFQCDLNEQGVIASNIVACIPAGTNQEIPVGSTLPVPTKGVYECTRKPDGTILMNLKQGCVYENKLVDNGKTFTTSDTQLTCIYGNEKFEVKPTACLAPGRGPVTLNTYAVVNGKYYKCVQSQKYPNRAEFVEYSG